MIHLIVGNTGSGKTTYSLDLKERTKGIIFSIDKWNNILFFPDMTSEDGLEWILERMRRSEEMIMSLVQQLEANNIDTILDLGLSKFEHRQKFRDFAQRHGYQTKLHFLDVSSEMRWQRVQQRNNEKGASFEFEVTRENFDFMESWFERPNKEEMNEGLVIRE